MIALRLEQPEDAAAIREVHRLAFGGAAEADLVDALREAGAGVLSMVVVEGAAGGGAGGAGDVVGHVLYTWVIVDTEQGEQVPVLGLAPVAVRPDRQGEGIGTRLIETSLEWLREEGYAAVVLVGHPEYYPRFGFLPASRWGLAWEVDVPDGVFQALELSAGGLTGVRGIVRYRPEFSGMEGSGVPE
jgi:putative acetyltransferase